MALLRPPPQSKILATPLALTISILVLYVYQIGASLRIVFTINFHYLHYSILNCNYNLSSYPLTTKFSKDFVSNHQND